MKVRCYGCGSNYDPKDDLVSIRHCKHQSNTDLDRTTILEMLNELQQERDNAVRRFTSAERANTVAEDNINIITAERDEAYAQYAELKAQKAGIMEGYGSD